MEYVYIIVSKLVNNVNEALLDGFIIQGVYTDYEIAEKEMLKHFEFLRDGLDAIGYEIQKGLECSKGATKKPVIYWRNGKSTVFTIQERILDQITYNE